MVAKKRRYGLPNMFAGYSDQLVQDFFAHSYRDRGMKKWIGYYLSDHTSALNKQHEQYMHPEQPLPEQTMMEITKRLDFAYRNGKLVTVQLRHVDSNGHLDQMLTGIVAGYQDDNIYVAGQEVALDDIRHIEVAQ